MTWYGHHLVLLISISKAPTWSPSSPAWHHDLHHHDLHHRVAIGVITPTMLLLLLLPLSNKVNHYIALNDWHTGHTIIKDNPMAPAGCRIHRMQVVIIYTNMVISYIKYISSCLWPYHITKHLLQKQVRRPLIVVASFMWLQLGSSKNVSYLHKNHNVICQLLFTLHKDPFHRIRSN